MDARTRYGLAILRRKASGSLHLAALALTATGLTFAKAISTSVILAGTFITFCLITMIYGLNDYIDEHDAGSSSGVWLGWFIGLGGAAMVIAVGLLPRTSIWAAFGILILGVGYSLQFSSFRLKDLYFLKNALIGGGWALLLLLGSGGLSTRGMGTMVLFVAIQVFIGSVMRDLDDVDEDRSRGISTLPLALGIDQTLTLLHAVNILSGAIVLLEPGFSAFIAVVTWRALLLALLYSKELRTSALLQTGNLCTCLIIFGSRLVTLWN